ncbi:unnamed protein product [Oncorhynchus mykiss]|uniref:Transmembrane and TPR repeat-containing protein 3 n=1 Tax=Oncorhynchus mykiss TaxID=8022 RepID=A0A060WPC4_ONCMY|nr:unnamed protein product [Oncorhynchus mykiss]
MAVVSWNEILILTGLVLGCYWNSLSCGCVFNDVSAILDNKDLWPATPLCNLFFNDFWGTPMSEERSHKYYRHLTVLTFRLNYLFSELCILPPAQHRATCRGVYLQPGGGPAFCSAPHPHRGRDWCCRKSGAPVLHLPPGSVPGLYTRSKGADHSIVWTPIAVTVVLVAAATLCKEQGITVIAMRCLLHKGHSSSS